MYPSNTLHQDLRLGVVSTPDLTRIALLAGSAAVTGFAINEGMRRAWWRGDRRAFHFAEDRRYARDLDKLGHVYAGYAASLISYRLVNWTGLSENRSAWYGATLGLLFQLYVEIQDGFATDWGFERYDMAGNILGTVYFLARHYIPVLKYTGLKFSYYPSARYGTPKGHEGIWTDVAQSWVDDYEGQTYWLSLKAGDAAADYLSAPSWMRFFNIAIGWSLTDFRKEWEWYLALDWNMEAMPGTNWYLRRFWELFDLIKLPAPAVRVAPDGAVWFGVYL